MNLNFDPVERYLARFKKSLHGVHAEAQEEILSDIRSLIQEHLDGKTTVEAVLQRLGPPEALADAYHMEGLLSQAAYSSSPLLLIKAALRGACTGMRGFITALTVFMGYAISVICFLVSLVKTTIPKETRLWVGPKTLQLGFMKTPPPAGAWDVLGTWTTPVGCLFALLCFVLTTLLARWFIRNHVRSFPFDSI